MDQAKYSEWHQGWLAFRSGKALRTIHRTVKVFRTQEAAERALKASKAVWGWR
jgi:hypothetical protein